MSKFSQLAGLPTTTHETGTVEPANPVPPAPPITPPPTVKAVVPPVYENPLDDMPIANNHEPFSAPTDIPTDLKWVSKIKLEEIGRSVGIELDRRLSQPKLVEQLEAHLATIGK